ncbi:hypothetical protein GCM10027168_22380 [Streptomyces capparidis]
MGKRAVRASVYISVDVEADGPIPGPYSMLSLGAAVAGRQDADGYAPADPRERTFYRELRPVGEEFVPEALAVGGLDRDRLAAEGAEPAVAMAEFAAWVEEVREGAQAVFTGYPAVYDWMFVHWYLTRFTGSSPFGHSRCMDVKTLYAARAGVPLGSVAKRSMSPRVLPRARHTHHALDDAVEQAELFSNVMLWSGR